MRINFLVPTTDVYGGIRVVFELANQLEKRGHRVLVTVPVFPPVAENSIRDYLRAIKDTPIRLFDQRQIDWFDLRARLVQVPHLGFESRVPDADVAIATWWKTAEFLESYSMEKGEKFYFIQHYETHAGPTDRVERTYRLPFNRIVTSSWLESKVQELGVSTLGRVTYGVNHDVFYRDEGADYTVDEPIRVGMMFSQRRWKGCPEGFQAFEHVQRSVDKDLQLVLFGKSLPDSEDLPQNAEFHFDPEQSQLRELYQSMDVFMMPSHHEGFGMPPMEAMACGTAVIATDVGAVRDYTVPGETALVVPPEDAEALGEALAGLVKNQSRITEMAKRGHEYIQSFTWESAGEKFEKLVVQSIERDGPKDGA